MSADPHDSSWRYEQGNKAVRYRERSSKRRIREARLLERTLEGRKLGTLLDVPCGAARLAELIESLGGSWYGADLSKSMLREARLSGAGRLLRAKAEQLPFNDQAFDTLLCFRFLHHLEPAVQQELLAELARVARKRIVISGFSPQSFHELQRKLRILLTRKTRARFPSSVASISRSFASHGFVARSLIHDGFGRDLWLGLWERED